MRPVISQILTSASEIRLDRKIDSKGLFSDLKNGQIVEARVDQCFSSRHARLMIQGKGVSARTHLPLQPGQKMRLRVTHEGPYPRFQLIETTGRNRLYVPSDILRSPDRPGPFIHLSRWLAVMVHRKSTAGVGFETGAGERMGQLLETMAASTGQPDPDRVRGFVRQGGFTWENKLASIRMARKSLSPALVQRLIEGDLKALSMLIVRNAAEEGGPWVEEIRAFLENLEQLQLFNSRLLGESGRCFLPLPILFDAHIRFGQMLIDLGRDSSEDAEKKERVVRVSLLLEMSELGHLLVELSLLKNAVTGVFHVEDHTVQTQIRDRLPELVDRLTAVGFQVHEMTCRTVSPRSLETVSLADRLIDDRDGVLRIVV